MYKKSLAALLREDERCIVVPCVYDGASARAVEIAGFEAMMFSGGEYAIASTGLIDNGFNNATDIELAVSRVAASSPLPLAVDIEGGFGGPVVVYRTAKRLARAGAAALQLEDGADSEKTGEVLSREAYFAKVRAAVAALEGTDTILIARTNVNPADDIDEAVARCIGAVELGAHMTTVVKLNNLEDATYVAERVPGWKMYPDASARDGVPEVTVDQLEALGFRMLTVHYLLKAAMEGMIEHGLANFANRDVTYTVANAPATGLHSESASAIFDPHGFMALEAKFTGTQRDYRLGAHAIPGVPEHLKAAPAEDRF